MAQQTTADGSLRVYVLKNIEEILTSAHRDRLWQFALIFLTALLLSVLIGGGVWYVITTRRQQDKLIQLNKILDQQANTDMLTGLANRRHFMALGEQELSRTIRYGGELSLLMLDIDYFKNVNDMHGHHVGDLVLQKLGDVCRETLRDIDTVGRIGGEEFAVLLPQTSNEQASEAAERLRAVISSSETLPEQGLPVHFTVSIGVTTLVDKSTNLDRLLSEADKALYEAKEQGRNKVCAWKN